MLCDFPQALGYSVRLVEARRALVREEHPDVAVALRSVGNMYLRLGRYQQGLEWHLRTLDLNQSLF